MSTENRYELNKNLAQMLKGGVIMDVTTPEQAKIAEAAGAAAVMALERIPADIRAAGGVSRMSDPKMIKGMHSSQNEQDNRYYARSAKVALLEPSDSQECKDFMKEAYRISERFDMPVLFRTTTRISHSKSLVSFAG